MSTDSNQRSCLPTTCTNLSEPTKTKIKISTGVIVFIGLLLMCILLPLSFSYIDYYDIAFKKNTVTNDVIENKVYGVGRYLWSPSHTPFKFSSVYQRISYRGSDLLVFSKRGLEFQIEVDAYYKINQTNVIPIFKDFGQGYDERFRDAIKASIKNTAPLFTLEEYLTQREKITRVMHNDVNKNLHSLHIHIEPYKFTVLRINFPDAIKNKSLQTAVQ